MANHHLVRVGVLGQVGRFMAVDAVRYPRQTRVVLRTTRGLELGEILAAPSNQSNGEAADGAILRGMTAADHLLEARLEKNRQAALDACAVRLAEQQLTATLLDVEQLFDGRTLWFYFLGPVTSEVQAVADELAEVYETHVQLRQFTETLTAGCGPDCGSKSAGGAGCTSCSAGCAVSSVCGTRKRA